MSVLVQVLVQLLAEVKWKPFLVVQQLIYCTQGGKSTSKNNRIYDLKPGKDINTSKTSRSE